MAMSSEGRRFSIDAAVAIPAEPPPMMTTSWFSLWAMTNSPIYFSLLAEPLAQAGQIVTGPPSASDALIGGCILDVGERIGRVGPCPGATEREHFPARLFAHLGEHLERQLGQFT